MAPPKQAHSSSFTKKDVADLTLEEEALMRQWIEYKKTVISKSNPQALPHSVLSELNNALISKSYFVGNKVTKADFEVHSGLHKFYANQTFQVKEKYLHLSRWFSHIQHLNPECLQILPFSRSILY